jgi:polar amino acid transport system permease protein
VQLVRATPLLIQLIYIYFALPFAGIHLDPFLAAFVGLTLNVTAYLSEVYRSGIEAVPKGQRDAAAALGMRPWVITARVVLPQAIRIVIPALGNYMVSLFKDTSLAAVITVQELLFTGQIIAARNYDYFTIYTLVFVLYFAVGYPAIRLVMLIENRVKRGYAKRRVAIATAAPQAATVEVP